MALRQGWFERNERDGQCYCGCGQKTAIADRTSESRGLVKGYYKRFVRGHNIRGDWREVNHPSLGKTMDKANAWKGGRRVNSCGYVQVYVPEHPAAVHGYVSEHRLVMEDAIGRRLDPEEVVHHINRDRTDNRLENLLLFMDQGDHARHHWALRKAGLDVG